MKEVTLKFREVAVDGAPEETCEVVALLMDGYGRDRFYSIGNMGYSAKNKAFNSYDNQPEYTGQISKDVRFWCLKSEYDEILKEDAQNVQTLD